METKYFSLPESLSINIENVASLVKPSDRFLA